MNIHFPVGKGHNELYELLGCEPLCEVLLQVPQSIDNKDYEDMEVSPVPPSKLQTPFGKYIVPGFIDRQQV